jgi:hypothetical protein
VSDDFDRRVEERMAEWARFYEDKGVAVASPVLDRVIAEDEVRQEMAEEGEPS